MKDLKVTTVGYIVIFLMNEGLRFLRYQILAPIFVINFCLVVLSIVILLTVFIPNPGSLINPLIDVSNLSFNLHMSNKEILQLYGWLSLIIYTLTIFFDKVLKINIKFSPNRNTILITDILLLIFCFTGLAWSNKDTVTSFLIPFLIMSAIIIVWILVAVTLSSFISKTLIVLEKILQTA